MAATSVQDDGRAGGAIPITIEATRTASPASNLALDNQGNLTLAQWDGSTRTIIFQVIANATSGANNVVLSDSNHQAHILGTLLADLAATINGVATMNGSGTGLSVAHNAFFNSSLTVSTKVVLPTGSLSRIAQFGPYNVTSTSAFYNHNLGVIPDMVLLTCDDTNGRNQPTPNFSTMTATQVALVTSLTTVTVVRGLAIKF